MTKEDWDRIWKDTDKAIEHMKKIIRWAEAGKSKNKKKGQAK